MKQILLLIVFFLLLSSFLKRRSLLVLNPMDCTGLIFLHLAHTRADIANVSSCWICTQMPHSSENGVPLEAVPFGWAEICSRFPEILMAADDERKMSGKIGWERGGYNCNQFKDSYRPTYDKDKMPSHVCVSVTI